MAKRRRNDDYSAHKDVEYAVDDPRGQGRTRHFPAFAEAAAHAVVMALNYGGRVFIDVIVYSKDGARSFGGSDAVEQYMEDPEASVFERLEVKVNGMGRVP